MKLALHSFASAVLLAAAACGGAQQPPASSADPAANAANAPASSSGDSTPAGTTGATSAPAPTSASASPAAPATAATGSASAPSAPKAATAADAAAACTTTATYDKKEANKITFKVKNTSSREVKMCKLEFYVYDKAGAQLAHHTLPYNYAIAPGESDGQGFEFGDLGKEVGKKTVDSIETVISGARFTSGEEFDDKSVAPDKRPRAGKK